jgi:hypothetical protein
MLAELTLCCIFPTYSSLERISRRNMGDDRRGGDAAPSATDCSFQQDVNIRARAGNHARGPQPGRIIR